LVYSELPGELAPKLALGLAAEAAGEREAAIHFYDIVSLTDPAFTSATFGMARSLVAAERRDDAIAAYGRVPASSSAYAKAQVAIARAWLLTNAAATPGLAELSHAEQAITALSLDEMLHHRLAVEIQQKALNLMEANVIPAAPSTQIFGQTMDREHLRTGIEKALRGMARLVQTREERISLVDLANQMRPATIV